MIKYHSLVLGRFGLGLLLLIVLALATPPAVVQAAPVRDDPVVYVVKAGDRLVDIAARYNVSASAIARANGLANADTIYVGQRLTIPSSAGATTGSSSAGSGAGATTGSSGAGSSSEGSSASIYHTVKPGETLAKIARAYGVTAASIIQANNITTPNVIWVGQRLAIPGGRLLPTPTLAPTPAPTRAAPTVHVVQAGETLSQIAQRYGTTVAALVAQNGLGSADVIRVGMQLAIPKPGAAVTYTGQATRFVVSISQQRCWLYRGDTVISKWVCSTGRSGSGTRPGSYRIQSKLPKAYGSTWNIWMPFWLGIYWAGASENGIHGLPWNAKTGAQVWSGYVGTPITYGCVMLDNVNAKMLYDMAYIGMPVVINP